MGCPHVVLAKHNHVKQAGELFPLRNLPSVELHAGCYTASACPSPAPLCVQQMKAKTAQMDADLLIANHPNQTQSPYPPNCALLFLPALQEVKAKTAQMDADLAARQSGLEAQEQVRWPVQHVEVFMCPMCPMWRFSCVPCAEREGFHVCHVPNVEALAEVLAMRWGRLAAMCCCAALPESRLRRPRRLTYVQAMQFACFASQPAGTRHGQGEGGDH